MNTILPTNPFLPAPASPSQSVGNWRLGGMPKAQVPLLALAFSVVFHAGFLLAFNQHDLRVALPPKPKVVIVEWTPLPDTPETPQPATSKDLKETPTVPVPQIPDKPGPIKVDTGFVQPVEPTRPVIDFGKKISVIPTNPGDGGPGSVPTGTPFNPSQLDRIPRAIAQPAPRFPGELQNQVSSAEVVVEFIVDSNGSVQGATIISSTHYGFERAALDGVRQWKFKPGMKDGRKVSTRLRQPIEFTLEGSTER